MVYCDTAKIKELVRHYNEFITFQISIWDSQEEDVPAPEKPAEEPKADEGEVKVTDEETEEIEETPAPVKQTVWGWEQINSVQPLWTRPSSEIKEEEYKKFFQSLGDFQDPLSHIHFRAEGELEFTALVYIPATLPPSAFDFANLRSGVKLYVKRVFISDKFDELLPNYLSFIKGVTDSDDLPLNVSREMLQQSKLLKTIQRKLTRKVIQMFQDLADAEDQKQWEEFCKLYHQFIKVGITRDTSNRARLAKLVRFHSTLSGEKQVGFEQYISKMKEGQNSIYYLGGDDLENLRKSPLLERANKKGIEVLLFTHPVDEYMAGALQKYEKYQLVDISKSGLKLEGDTPQEELTKTFKPLTDYLTDVLKTKVQRVEVTTRLTSTPCALVSPQWGPSANMERITRAQALQDGSNQNLRFSKKVLELNPRHPIVKKLLETVEAAAQNEGTLDVAALLYDTAALHSGVPLEAPLVVANRLDKVIAHALNIDPSETAEEEEIAPLPEKSADSTDSEEKADDVPDFKFDGLQENGGTWSVEKDDL